MRIFTSTAILALMLVFSHVAPAQEGLRGRLSDENNKPLAHANVLLMRPDSSLVMGTTSDVSGNFSLASPAAGQYHLRITAIGYQRKLTDPFPISASVAGKDFGQITLEPLVRTMQDVSVTALRPTITQLPDRMVVTIQGTAMAAGNTAFDVLGRSPGVFIDHEGNIQLNGRSGVTVMIDGRQTYLSARDLRNFLETMPAENIKSIEIITNPSSRHEAEGSSGIINIVLRKNTQQGINGSVYAGLTYNWKHFGHSFGGNINHKSGNWNSFLNIDRVRRVGGREATFTRVFIRPQGKTYFDQYAEGNFIAQGPPTVRAGTDYTINSKHSVGGMVYYNTNTAHINFLSETYIGTDPHAPNIFIDADNHSKNTFSNFTSNLHYVFKTDTIGSTITSDLDYIRITNRGESGFYNFYDSLFNNNDYQDFLYTKTPNSFNIYSARLDLIKMFSKGRKLEAGLRYSSVSSDNDSRFYFNNGSLVPDPSRTNHFRYDEAISAAYTNYTTGIGKKLNLQTGLRVERTESVGNLITTGQVTKRDYIDFFPSVFLQHKVNDNYNMTWSYSKRVQRPNYGNLNPFRSYRDPYTYWEGNPYLKPQYSHSFSLSQTFRKVYILTVNYQFNKDFMAELPKLDVGNATTIYYIGNVDGAYNYGATAIVPIRFTKKWDSQNTFVLSYNHNRIIVDNQPLVNEQWYQSIQSAHTILLPKDFRFEVNFIYQGPSAYGLYSISPRTRLDLALRKSFLKKKLDVTLNIVDVYKGVRLKFNTRINGNINDFDQYLRARFTGITFRYNFSKGQKVDIRRNNNVEEVNRTGG
jgi:iron complex outermembrane receptor protein